MPMRKHYLLGRANNSNTEHYEWANSVTDILARTGIPLLSARMTTEQCVSVTDILARTGIPLLSAQMMMM